MVKIPVKVLLGLVAAVVIAAGGFFGFELYTQHRIATEIDAAFAQIRAGGGRASHGPIKFDLFKRTVTIADIVTESAAQPPISVKIANITAQHVAQPDPAHFSADSIDVSDAEFGAGLSGALSGRITYKSPRITVRDFSGPVGAKPPAFASSLDAIRFGLEQFAEVTATSITAQDLAGTMNVATAPAVGGNGDFAYSSLAMEGIKDGKIASLRVDGMNFTLTTQAAGKTDKLTGNVANAVSSDIDTAALAAILDPQTTADRYIRAYRQVSMGAYTFTSAQGLRGHIDGITIDDVGARPAKMQLAALLDLFSTPGTVPTPAQAREMMEKVAGLYEGLHLGNAEIRGMSMETPQGPLKLEAIRYNLDNGKGDFSIEGIDARMPNGPFQMGRLALKSFDIAGLMRLSAQLATPGQPPSAAQALAPLRLLEGIEVEGVVAPFKTTNKQVSIDNVRLNWGQFVGVIPTQAHLVAKMAAPVDATDPQQQPLVAAGLDRLAVDLDLGATWTEASESFALAPATIDIGNLVKASARLSLAKVPRGVFSPELAQAMNVAPQIEAGAIELNLRDAGALDLAVAQYARIKNLSREAARADIIANIKASGEQLASANPDGAAAVEAITRFVETPGQTLVIKLAPRATAPVLQLLQLLKTDPPTALAQFKIEASTGL
jgi:hypothetical protein